MSNTSKDEILTVAYELFCKNGYANTFMSDVAKICGVKKPTVYYYFENKKVLALKLLERQKDRYLQLYSVTLLDSKEHTYNNKKKMFLEIINDLLNDQNGYCIITQLATEQSEVSNEAKQLLYSIFISLRGSLKKLLEHKLDKKTAENRAESITLKFFGFLILSKHAANLELQTSIVDLLKKEL